MTAIADDVFYKAYLNQDRSFEGIFFLAVKTTGIFCRPGCKARAPKRENVEFFSTPDEALGQGYRPCKKCHPLQAQGEVPQWVQQALHLVEHNPDQRISDELLQQNNIDPVRVRRWFKSNHSMTFQNYQRMKKMGEASIRITQGNKVIDSALDSGYQSLSGFNESFKKMTGITPTSAKGRNIITMAQLLTPLGPMYAATSEQGICLLEFTDRKALQRQITRIQKNLKGIFTPGEHPLLKDLQIQLDEYFANKRQQFDVPLHLSGSEFQVSAWKALQQIPYGTTRNYQQQAEVIGNPKAIRAIASANAANAMAIIVPCHRVIAKSGQMAGYAGGIWRKQYLIKLEQQSMVSRS